MLTTRSNWSVTTHAVRDWERTSWPPMNSPGTTSFHGSAHSGIDVARPLPRQLAQSGCASGSA